MTTAAAAAAPDIPDAPSEHSDDHFEEILDHYRVKCEPEMRLKFKKELISYKLGVCVASPWAFTHAPRFRLTAKPVDETSLPGRSIQKLLILPQQTTAALYSKKLGWGILRLQFVAGYNWKLRKCMLDYRVTTKWSDGARVKMKERYSANNNLLLRAKWNLDMDFPDLEGHLGGFGEGAMGAVDLDYGRMELDVTQADMVIDLDGFEPATARACAGSPGGAGAGKGASRPDRDLATKGLWATFTRRGSPTGSILSPASCTIEELGCGVGSSGSSGSSSSSSSGAAGTDNSTPGSGSSASGGSGGSGGGSVGVSTDAVVDAVQVVGAGGGGGGVGGVDVSMLLTGRAGAAGVGSSDVGSSSMVGSKPQRKKLFGSLQTCNVANVQGTGGAACPAGGASAGPAAASTAPASAATPAVTPAAASTGTTAASSAAATAAAPAAAAPVGHFYVYQLFCKTHPYLFHCKK
ncbi:MAG: hypothetical protein WDW38_006022 [Sanguina aurantia]